MCPGNTDTPCYLYQTLGSHPRGRRLYCYPRRSCHSTSMAVAPRDRTTSARNRVLRIITRRPCTFFGFAPTPDCPDRHPQLINQKRRSEQFPTGDTQPVLEPGKDCSKSNHEPSVRGQSLHHRRDHGLCPTTLTLFRQLSHWSIYHQRPHSS